MYTSFVRSTLDYASVVWDGTYKSDFLILEKIQVDAMRLITGATARSNRLKLYQEIPFLTIKQRVSSSTLSICITVVTPLTEHKYRIKFNKVDLHKNYKNHL